jgi:hypothetical protein
MPIPSFPHNYYCLLFTIKKKKTHPLFSGMSGTAPIS